MIPIRILFQRYGSTLVHSTFCWTPIVPRWWSIRIAQRYLLQGTTFEIRFRMLLSEMWKWWIDVEEHEESSFLVHTSPKTFLPTYTCYTYTYVYSLLKRLTQYFWIIITVNTKIAMFSRISNTAFTKKQYGRSVLSSVILLYYLKL
jgi:hypothetical protein